MAEDWSTSDGNAICTSGFVDEVISAHDGANGPESKTTRMFRRFFQMTAPVGPQGHRCLIEFARWPHCGRIKLLFMIAGLLKI